jgi:hypothetical protein
VIDRAIAFAPLIAETKIKGRLEIKRKKLRQATRSEAGDLNQDPKKHPYVNNKHGEKRMKNLEELSALQVKAESIKAESEAFVDAAKRLSKEGLKDAEKLIEFAKANWKSVLAATALLGVGGAAYSGRKQIAKAAVSLKKRTFKAMPSLKTKRVAKKVASKAKKAMPSAAKAKSAAKSGLSAASRMSK